MTYHRFSVDPHDCGPLYDGMLVCCECDAILRAGEPAVAVHVKAPSPHVVYCPECFAGLLAANPGAVEVEA
jgi:hypothetical protein